MGYSTYNKSRFRGDIPVKEGETYDVVIEGIGEKGDGIARIKGYVVIVPNTKKGDKVKVKVTAVRGKVSFGEAVGKAEGKVKAEEEESEESEEETGEAGEETEEAEEESEEAEEETGETEEEENLE